MKAAEYNFIVSVIPKEGLEGSRHAMVWQRQRYKGMISHDTAHHCVITEMCRGTCWHAKLNACLWLRRHNISQALTYCRRYHESLAESLARHYIYLLHHATKDVVACHKGGGFINLIINLWSKQRVCYCCCDIHVIRKVKNLEGPECRNEQQLQVFTI